MPSLIQGRIVYCIDPVADPHGRNPKPHRPFVVISKNSDIEREDTVACVGISTSVLGNAEEVELPYGNNCRTGLKQKSAAICNWQVQLPKAMLEFQNGYVPPKQLEAILGKTRGHT